MQRQGGGGDGLQSQYQCAGFSYAGGTPTIHENGSVLHLAFTGDYITADFSLQAAANGAGTALIGVAPSS